MIPVAKAPPLRAICQKVSFVAVPCAHDTVSKDRPTPSKRTSGKILGQNLNQPPDRKPIAGNPICHQDVRNAPSGAPTGCPATSLHYLRMYCTSMRIRHPMKLCGCTLRVSYPPRVYPAMKTSNHATMHSCRSGLHSILGGGRGGHVRA